MQTQAQERHVESQFSHMTSKMKSSMIRELVASTKGIPGLISLAGGFPSPLTFPAADLARLYHDVIISDGDDILQYGASEGDTKLKAQLKQLENMPQMPDDQLLITCGATNGIFMYTQTFINPGDVIISEAPSFLGSLVAFEGCGAELMGIEMDDEGMKLDVLEAAIAQAKADGKNVKFIYIIPEFQNPTGISTSLPRRRAILSIAAKHKINVLEDNPYGLLRYEGEALPSMFRIAREEMGREDIVTMVKSFSKVLGPGLRLAYVMGPSEVLGKMCSWLQKVNVSVDCIAQRAVAKFLADGMLHGQIERIKEHYQPNLHAMLDALQKFMPQGVRWTHPEGGMFIWITLPEGMNADELFEAAKAHKVAFVPGSKFYPSDSEVYNVLRLNFSYPTAEQITEGVRRLAELTNEALQA